jgi:hypothetical protein
MISCTPSWPMRSTKPSRSASACRTSTASQQGAIAMIDAFLLHQEADMDRTEYSELLTRLKAFLQSAA